MIILSLIMACMLFICLGYFGIELINHWMNFKCKFDLICGIVVIITGTIILVLIFITLLKQLGVL